MKKRLEIELFEEHTNVNIYTIRFKNEISEIEKFLDKFPQGCEFDLDISTIIKWLDNIGKRGALERYFRIEGKFKDRVFALPIENSNLRLYVIRISDEILILGNGGTKKTKVYNKDPELNSIVEQLQTIDCLITAKERQGLIQIKENNYLGNLSSKSNHEKEP
ncbi:MAG: hypothetical protein IPN67_16600 [Bacteroidales bacterium]|nr:hypothetical protein [Bacteroidales bacterium]